MKQPMNPSMEDPPMGKSTDFRESKARRRRDE